MSQFLIFSCIDLNRTVSSKKFSFCYSLCYRGNYLFKMTTKERKWKLWTSDCKNSPFLRLDAAILGPSV